MASVRKSRRIRRSNFFGAFLTIGIVAGISYLIASSVTLVEVPDKCLAVKVEKPLLSWFFDNTIETLPPGVHETSGKSEIFSIDTSNSRKLSYRAALPGDFANRWIPGMKGEPPLLIKGHLTLALEKRVAEGLVQKRKNVDVELELLPALEGALKEHRGLQGNKDEYAARTLETVRTRMPAGSENTIVSLTIEEIVTDDGSGTSSIEPLATRLEPLADVPLKVFARYFWVTGVVTLVFVLAYLVFPRLFVVLSGLILVIPLALINLFGGDLDMPFDFDMPDIDVDIDL